MLNLLARLGEIANAALFLVSDEASFITEQTLNKIPMFEKGVADRRPLN